MNTGQKTPSPYEQWREAASYEDRVRAAYLDALRLERTTASSSPLLPLRTQARHEARTLYETAMQETDAALARYRRAQQNREAA